MWWFIFVELVVVFVMVLYLYQIYGSFQNREWYVSISTVFGWTICFFIVFLVPNDVTSSNYVKCLENNGMNCIPPLTDLSPSQLEHLWGFLYWTSFFLTWLIYPLLQSYSVAGDFSFLRKLKTAVRQNIVFYGIAGVLLGALLILVASIGKFQLNTLPGLAIAMGNAWGLGLLLGLLGAGLIQAPRYLWRIYKRDTHLNHLYFRLAHYHSKHVATRLKLIKVIQRVQAAAEMLAEEHPHRAYIETILRRIPPEEQKNALGVDVGPTKEPDLSYDGLAKLNARTRDALFDRDRYYVMYHECLISVFKLEDIVNGDYMIATTDQVGFCFNLWRLLKYVTVIYLEPISLLLLCGITWLISIALIWSESICFLGLIKDWDPTPILSIPAQILALPYTNYVVQAIAFVTIGYMATCAYSALWQLRLFDYYRLVPHHQTDSNSLLFSSAYSCRLITPLAYNFLILINHEDSVFFKVIGPMNVASFVGPTFSKLFPLLVLLFAFLTVFDLYARIKDLLHIKQFHYDEAKDLEQIKIGKQLASSERDLDPINEYYKDELPKEPSPDQYNAL